MTPATQLHCTDYRQKTVVSVNIFGLFPMGFLRKNNSSPAQNRHFVYAANGLLYVRKKGPPDIIGWALVS
jgi:hypothetical protein